MSNRVIVVLFVIVGLIGIALGMSVGVFNGEWRYGVYRILGGLFLIGLAVYFSRDNR